MISVFGVYITEAFQAGLYSFLKADFIRVKAYRTTLYKLFKISLIIT